MVKSAIVNVVATATLNQKVDLYELEKFKEILHDPEIYGGRVAYFKSSDMKGKVSIFTSGKIISIGTKSENDAIRELECAKIFLTDKGIIKPVLLKTVIQNIVVVTDLEEGVNLEKMATNCKIIYEPEQFPGGIMRVKKPHQATILVFASGKIVITGVKSSDQIEPVIGSLVRLLRKCNRD
jgi:transcription initiation factor TFIID TATA-box-binding protein